MTIDQLRHEVSDLLDVGPDQLGADDNLVNHGLDSVRVMALAERLRAHGADITFLDMIERPTLRDWLTMLP
ncbi:MAG TPA: phosphopantetheine-binding protein [Pseudonocardiaceae bacterium]|jgi:bifunctional isochorismate lyase/aryl carrier protein